MRRNLNLLMLLVLPLSACAPMPPGPPSQAGQCVDAPAQWAVGKTATADVVERVRVDTHSRTARVLKPGEVVTMEFNAERVNIYVDANGRIERVACG